MQPTLVYQVRPALPERLSPISNIASNIWFSWNHEGEELFRRMDGGLWEKHKHNPMALLNEMDQERLEYLARDAGFVAQMERVASDLEAYTSLQGCAFLDRRAPSCFQVAYFSAEYGLAECLPIYSGGLGMLSGDHLKSASDLNLPLVGVGLAYRQGYFNQYLNPDGWQMEEYRLNDFYNMPMELERDAQGNEVRVSVDIEGRPLQARIWRVRVGRVPLYLLDANIKDNPEDLRVITYQLYGGDSEMRIRQEILLGIGGVRLLKALGIEATVYHMNEGHSAFASLERIRLLREEHGLSFDEAREMVKATNCFTTHTPVPAGNDYFPPELVQRHFSQYVAGVGISLPVLMGYGRINPFDQSELFCMTVLALRLSAFNNGVSRLHGEVARGMWQGVYPHFPLEDVPITSITNGVHISSHISGEMAYLFDRHLGTGWKEDPDSKAVWGQAGKIPDTELWRVHERGRANLISRVRQLLKTQLIRRGATSEEQARAEQVLNPNVLTIVFARRFATYKRAVLLLSDLTRLEKIINNPERPVQIIFAGKAHPKDNEGKEFIRRVIEVTRNRKFRDSIVFLEDYDINLAHYLVQGADVWLNNPRRPMEACGTSGMKAAANGGLNLSIMDGWWDEAFEPGIGWPIGRGEDHNNDQLADQVEAKELYRLLQYDVSRLFYDRDEKGLPRGWVTYMKNCLRKVCPEFNSHRQVEDYTDLAYLPASRRHLSLREEGHKGARELGAWVGRVMEHWTDAQVLEISTPNGSELTWGQEVVIKARVRLGGLSPDDIACDLYYGPLNAAGGFMGRETSRMEPQSGRDGVWEYEGRFTCRRNGRMGVKVRLTPFHPLASSEYALGLAAWG